MVARNGNSAQLQRWGFLYKDWTSWESQNTVVGSLRLHSESSLLSSHLVASASIEIIHSTLWPHSRDLITSHAFFLQPLLTTYSRGLILNLAIFSNCTAFKIVISSIPHSSLWLVLPHQRFFILISISNRLTLPLFHCPSPLSLFPPNLLISLLTQHGFCSPWWQSLTFMLSRFSCVRLFVTPWTVAHQVPLSMEFSRQEYWSGLPCSPPGESSRHRDRSLVASVSCIGRQVLYL